MTVKDVALAIWELYRDTTGIDLGAKLDDLDPGRQNAWLSLAEHAQGNLLRMEGQPAVEIARLFWQGASLGLPWEQLTVRERVAFEAVIRLLAGMVVDFDEQDRVLPLSRIDIKSKELAAGLERWRNWVRERVPAPPEPPVPVVENYVGA